MRPSKALVFQSFSRLKQNGLWNFFLKRPEQAHPLATLRLENLCCIQSHCVCKTDCFIIGAGSGAPPYFSTEKSKLVPSSNLVLPKLAEEIQKLRL